MTERSGFSNYCFIKTDGQPKSAALKISTQSGKRGSNSRPSAREELSSYALTPLRGVKQPTELLPFIKNGLPSNYIRYPIGLTHGLTLWINQEIG